MFFFAWKLYDFMAIWAHVVLNTQIPYVPGLESRHETGGRGDHQWYQGATNLA